MLPFAPILSPHLPRSASAVPLSSKCKCKVDTLTLVQKFAFSKPLPEQNIIFFCRSGKRSATAAEWAGERGYGNVRNYIGSWLDWTKREKERDGNDD